MGESFQNLKAKLPSEGKEHLSWSIDALWSEFVKPHFNDGRKSPDQRAFGRIFDKEEHRAVREKCRRYAGEAEMARRREARDTFRQKIGPLFKMEMMHIWFTFATQTGYLPKDLNTQGIRRGRSHRRRGDICSRTEGGDK